MSRNKKKKKIAGQNLSLSERLERHWKNEKWEAFFSLYMRDREQSDRGPWADRFPDALYNCLTAALFLHRNYDGARQVAEIMLSERSLGPDGDTLRTCAKTALALINIKEGGIARLPEEEGLGIALPAPYGELRRKLEEGFAPVRRGRRKQAASNPLVEKLAKQFDALPSAKNSGPYNSFLKTAEALLAETEKTESAWIFKAVRDIASIMRDVARGVPEIRDPSGITSYISSSGYPLRTGCPALLALWEYMCKLGGLKFGGSWENAARAARMSLVFNEEFSPAYEKLMATGSPGENLPVAAERHYYGWTEQERFILIFLAVSGQTRDNDFLTNIPTKTLIRWFKTLGDIGGRRRSEGAWPMTVRLAFESLILSDEASRAELFARESLPFESMTVPTIITMLLYCPRIFGLMKDRLKSRLPMSLDDRDETVLEEYLPDMLFPVPALAAISGLLDKNGRHSFFKSVFIAQIRCDLDRVLASESHVPTLWSAMSRSHIELFAEKLREDSKAWAFFQLCLGQKQMTLSSDPSKIAAFFAPRPSEDPFLTSLLSLFLMTWPGVPAEFLLRLFEDSLDGHEQVKQWKMIPKVISRIHSPEDRKNIARGVSQILKRRYRNRRVLGLDAAISDLRSLEKGGKLPERHDRRPGAFDGIDFDGLDLDKEDIMEIIKRIIKR
ncbi:MAG: hypothetical protein LBG29_06090 [Synergistaceae bacterium]|nr:hypothetical protein [Synergistaceae bacterium]